jgi:hypothetical protein
LSAKNRKKDMKKQLINRVLDGAVIVTLLAAFTLTANAVPGGFSAPDASSTIGLMSAACAGLAILRRFRR